MIVVAENSYFPKKLDVDKSIRTTIDKTGVIYCLFFPESGKRYIGQCEDFWRRMGSYKSAIKSGIMAKNQPNLYNAIVCYEYKFTTIVVEYGISFEELDEYEIKYIELYDTFRNGYNMTGGGKVLRGEAHPMFGKKHTQETKEQMSISRMGDPRPKGEEWCQEHSKKMSGENNPNFGGLSEEHKKMCSIAKIKKSIEKYADAGIDISEENMRDVLAKNNNNMLKTAKELGCHRMLVQRFCTRHDIDVSQNRHGENNPKRVQSIKDHALRGIDISYDNIVKVFKDNDNNVAKTAKVIGCRWQVIRSFCERNNLIQKNS